jgi:hypothetical protein
MASTTIMAPDWVARIAGTRIDEGNSVCMDNSGNSYILGYFTGTTNPVSIYNRDKTKTLPDLSVSTTSSIASNIFLVKYDPSGTALWRLRIGHTGTGNTTPYSMTIDNSDNLIIAGTFTANSPATIYNISDVSMVTLTTNTSGTGFIVKMDSNGQSVFWNKRFYNGQFGISPRSVKVDSQNNIYITGSYYNSNLTIEGAGSNLALISGSDTFLIKYDSAGTYKWATAVGGTGLNDLAYKVAVDKNDDIVITGYYDSTLLNIYDVNQSTFTRNTIEARTLTYSGNYDNFIIKYNTLGVSQWATRIGGIGTEYSYSIYIDNSNNIIVAGSYSTADVTFYSPSDISGLTLQTPSTTTALLGKYDTNGTFLWGTRIGSSSTSSRTPYNIVTDSQNNIYIHVSGSGNATNSVRPYDLSGINYTIDYVPNFFSSSGSYLIKYSPDGYAKNLISMEASLSTYLGDTIFIKNDIIFLTANTLFDGQTLFKDVSNQYIDNMKLDNSGFTDAFIAKIQLPTTTVYNESYNSGFNDGLIDGSNNNTAQYSANYPLITDYYKKNIYINAYNYSKPLLPIASKYGSIDGYYAARYGSATPPFYNSNFIMQSTYNNIYTQRYAYYSNVQGDMKVNWATQVGGSSVEIPYGITVDNSGYIYNSGVYNSNQMLFYNANRTLSNITLDLSGSLNCYVAKYDSSGNIVWASKIQRDSITAYAYNIATDSENNAYVCGIYQTASVNFYNSDNTYSNVFLDNSGSYDIFLVKYNSTGFVQWALRLAGTSTDYSNSIKVDKDNNIYIAGISSSTSLNIYDSSKNLQYTLSNPAVSSMRFIAKFSKNGSFLWANKILGNVTLNIFPYLTIDNNNNLILSGITTSSDILKAYNVEGTNSLPDLSFGSVGTNSMYVYKFNSSGTPLWRSSIRNVNSNLGLTTIDKNNNIYIINAYTATTLNIMNSNDQNSGIILDLSGNCPYFIIKYSPEGYASWATRIANNTTPSIVTPRIIYSGNNLYAGITYASRATLYNSDGSASAYVFDTLGSTDSILVKYNLLGTVKWATRFGGTGIDNIRNITADANSNIYMSGTYNSAPLNILNSDNISALSLETSSQNAFIISYLNQAPILPPSGESLDDYLYNITVTPENREEYKDLIIQSYSSTPVQEAPASVVSSFVTDTAPGYDINAVPKILTIAAAGETVNITSVKDSLTSGATELYLFVATGDAFTLQINGSTYNLTMLANGITYNGTNYFLGDTILFDNTYKFTIKFLGSVGGPFELAAEPEPPVPAPSAPVDTRPIRRGPMSASDRIRQLQSRTIVADVARQRAAGGLPPRGSYDPTLVREAKLKYEVGAVNTSQAELDSYKNI